MMTPAHAKEASGIRENSTLIVWSAIPSATWAEVADPIRSCLLAYTRIGTPFSFSSHSSSCRGGEVNWNERKWSPATPAPSRQSAWCRRSRWHRWGCPCCQNSSSSTASLLRGSCSYRTMSYLILRWPPMSQTLSLNPSVWTDLMLNPCVGVIVLMSSLARVLRIVVLPALSRPSSKILSSRSGEAFSFLGDPM